MDMWTTSSGEEKGGEKGKKQHHLATSPSCAGFVVRTKRTYFVSDSAWAETTREEGCQDDSVNCSCVGKDKMKPKESG